jgi:E3 ubiquitin-protein ligase HECTD3
MFLGRHVDSTGSNLGSIKDYVDSIEVSSKSSGEEEENLTDNDTNTFWESDGSHGSHWIRLNMKKGIIIKKLLVAVGGDDSNYMPQLIHVMGGESLDELKTLSEVNIEQSIIGVSDVLVLPEQTDFFSIIEIRIKECKDHGIDTRIRGLKIKSCRDVDVGISRDLFVKSNLVRFPKLENFDQEDIYRRALILERMMKLLDSVLVYIMPLWDYSAGSYASLDVIKQLLPLSQKRMQLVDQFLGKTEMNVGQIPKVYINRRSAMEHREDPSADPEYHHSVFAQLYEGLKPKDVHQSAQHYRWGTHHDQWWECKFFSEGVIDQGGGFRDSISDLSEELCPSNSDQPEPLPFFIRSPNQKNDDASNYRDMYVPNPGCVEFHKYEWIGKLMGACLRGKEFLVLSLPSFFWKQLAGQSLLWQRDFLTVDEYQVRSLEAMVAMDETRFSAYFAERPRTWTATLSDGSTVPLKEGGANLDVSYADRLEYARLVREARMEESKKQVQAIQRGLQQVVPQAVLDLLTSQELNKKICGDPEIKIEDLRKYIHFKEQQQDDPRIKYLWTSLDNFSNEDRSRLIRFVTGRRRLPAPMHVYWSDSSQDSLPTSSTCGSSLYLPNYSSAKIMEEKLRYAMYNCVSIDTDTSPLDEY